MATTRTKNSPHKTTGAGRPRSVRVPVQLTQDEKSLVERAAALKGQSVKEFIADALRASAAQVVQEHAIIRLNPDESRQFIEALLNPPEPNEALRRAFLEHKRTVDSR